MSKLPSPEEMRFRAIADLTSGYRAFTPPDTLPAVDGVEKVYRLPTTGGGSIPWSRTGLEYMSEPLTESTSRLYEALVFVGPARAGKAIDCETPIATPTGWTTMGALEPGDTVFGSDGHPTAVLAVSDVMHDHTCYRVEFSDGTSIVADAGHLWGVERFFWKAPHWRYRVCTTEQMLSDLIYCSKSDGRRRSRYRVRNTDTLDLPDADLPIDPYVLGVWLGNGDSSGPKIINNPLDADHFTSEVSRAGYIPAPHSTPGVIRVKCPYLNGNGRPPTQNNLFLDNLRSLGLIGNKHIPREYLRSSPSQRLSLLQGLMDTDGWPGDGVSCHVDYSTVLPELKDNFLELCRSLGLRPKAALRTTKWNWAGETRGGTIWSIQFPAPRHLQLFRSPRKQLRLADSQTDVGCRRVVAITPVESVPVRCIKVAAENSLFLAGEGMIPTHNTEALVIGGLAHRIAHDPGDTLVISPTALKSRELSMTSIDRMFNNSPILRDLRHPSPQYDNVGDKMLRDGSYTRFGWPVASQFAATSYRYVFETDYDRYPLNIDGEGSAFSLGRKRIQTFMSRGKIIVESSPGHDITNPAWRPSDEFEAPPAQGIASIYNEGTRGRFFWPCPRCGEFFQAAPGLGLFGLPDDLSLLDQIETLDIPAFATEHASVICPHCNDRIPARHKAAMNASGKWVHAGQQINRNGTISGPRLKSRTLSYWLGGVCAAFQSWESLIERHLLGLRAFALTNDDTTLRSTVNTDQGASYIPIALRHGGETFSLRSNRDATFQRYHAPEWARYLIAAVDVQGGRNARFVVQVQAIGPFGEQVTIDRFEITESTRRQSPEGGPAPIDPATFLEDWSEIEDRAVLATWKTAHEGLELRPLRTIVDTGGEAGVTNNAYAWYRLLRAKRLNSRVIVAKGNPAAQAPPVKTSMVGARRPGDEGDIPLCLVGTDRMKDVVDAGLKRTSAGPGKIHLPGWVNESFLAEIEAEVRLPSGKWSQVKPRNETLDLLTYTQAAIRMIGADRLTDWSNPPEWALPVGDGNSEVISRDERRAEQADRAEPTAGAGTLASDLGVKPTQPVARRILAPRQRRVARWGG